MTCLIGLDRLKVKLKVVGKMLEHKAANRIQAAAMDVLVTAASMTPQWSGDTAASWQIVLDENAPDRGRTVLWQPFWWMNEHPSLRGDEGAIDIARSVGGYSIKDIKWYDYVRLVNGSQDAESISKKPDSEFRNGNYIPADVMAVAYLTSRYSFLTPSNSNFNLFAAP